LQLRVDDDVHCAAGCARGACRSRLASARGTAAAIARHLGLAVDLADIDKIVADLAALGLAIETVP